MSLPSHLQDLNPSQYEAVTHGLGPLLIFAGAGSGKTRVLTRRIAHLIYELGARPDEIFAVTFTNKAAKEMKQRVESLFVDQRLPLWVSTFHASCARILREHAKLLNYSSNFVIYDSSDSMSTLKRAYKKLNIDPKFVEPKAVISAIDKAKNDYKSADDLRNNHYLGRDFTEMVANLYTCYQEELQAADAMDFGDLLFNTVTLFKLEPKLLEHYQERFKYVLVDEYQDTNKVQYLLIRQLTGKHKNISVVGDDDQSIYSFRGANIETILNFKKDFTEAKVVTLNVNYRSSNNILSLASSLIKKNSQRQPKNISTPNPEGAKIICYKAFDAQDEAEFVAREISLLLSRGTKPSEVAIFYRTNAQSRSIEEAFCESGLPYQIFGGHRFYDRKEIKDIMAYYRLLLNPKDNESFLRIINTPTRGIGTSAITALSTYAKKENLSLLEALELGVKNNEPSLGKSILSKLVKFLEITIKLKDQLVRTEYLLSHENSDTFSLDQQDAIANLLKNIAQTSGYLQALKMQDTIEAESRIENIAELCRVAVEFSMRTLEQGQTPKLNEFLDRASLSSDLEEENSGKTKDPDTKIYQGSISMMTLHLAKGLEFDNVFLIGLEEGLLPHIRAAEDRQALEEERRLCYVGITRARKQLYLLRASDRQTFGRGGYGGIPSRFIKEIPRDVVEDRKSGFFTDFGEAFSNPTNKFSNRKYY